MADSAEEPRFFDGKETGALRTIGEVAAALGIRQHVLRYWEQQFPMLRPLKRSGGRRYYRAEDVDLVVTIDRLINREGYTLRGARQALANGGEAPQPGPASTSSAGVQSSVPAELVARLRTVREHLAAALAA